MGRVCAGHTLIFRVRTRKKTIWSGDGTNEPRLLCGSDRVLYEKAKAENFNLNRIDVTYLDLNQGIK